MTDADGRLVLHQHQRHRLAYDVTGAADDDDILAFQRDVFVLEKFEHTVGRAGRENRAADNKPTDIVEVEAVDILVGRYGA